MLVSMDGPDESTAVETEAERPAQALAIEVRPHGSPVGAEVVGVDATVPPSRAVAALLKRAIAEHCFVVLRDQRLDEDQHVAFAAGFGDTDVPWLNAVELNTLARIDELPGRPGYTGAHPGVVYFFNGPEYRDEPEDGYLQGWHADMTHVQVSLPYALLHALEAPERGYETWFANQYLAYEHLDPETRREVDGLLITHSFQHVFPKLPPVVHPVILAHPLTGRRAIYGIPGSADAHPLGMTPKQGAALMAKLTAHLDTGALVHKHVWRTGDLVIWDNRCVLHRRGPQLKGQTRILRRVMAGDGDPHEVRKALMS
jgi:taurine dioxygenase